MRWHYSLGALGIAAHHLAHIVKPIYAPCMQLDRASITLHLGHLKSV
jgi:hypothetical protein